MAGLEGRVVDALGREGERVSCQFADILRSFKRNGVCCRRRPSAFYVSLLWLVSKRNWLSLLCLETEVQKVASEWQE